MGAVVMKEYVQYNLFDTFRYRIVPCEGASKDPSKLDIPDDVLSFFFFDRIEGEYEFDGKLYKFTSKEAYNYSVTYMIGTLMRMKDVPKHKMAFPHPDREVRAKKDPEWPVIKERPVPGRRSEYYFIVHPGITVYEYHPV